MKCPECGNETKRAHFDDGTPFNACDTDDCNVFYLEDDGWALGNFAGRLCKRRIYKTGQQADTEADLYEKITGQRSPALERG